MKPNPICFPKQEFRFENEGDRDFEKKKTGEIPYTNLCSLLNFTLSIRASLFSFSFFSSFCIYCGYVYLLSFCISASLSCVLPFACWRLFIYREVWETVPTFFRSSTDRLMGNFHGPLSFLRAYAIPHSSAFWFVLFLEFFLHRY